MTDLTLAELDALAKLHAATPAAVYTPDDRRVYECPNTAGPPHRDCGRTLDVPTAQSLADHLARNGVDAHVVVYGVPWSVRHAQKPAQGA